MDFFGLDIGITSAKLVQLNKAKDKLNLVNIGSTELPNSGVNAETKNQMKEVVDSIRNLISGLDLSTKNVVFSLPEEKVTTRAKWFPPMKEKEVDSALKYEAETFVPHPLDKVQLDYQVIDKDEEGRLLVFIVGILKKEIEKYLQIAEMLGLNTLALEPESLSLNRILSVKELPMIIADINHNQTSLISTQNKNIFLSRSVPIGIKSLSRAIKINLGLKANEAEAYRRTYGLREEELEGRVREAMLPIVEKLIREIKQTALSFQKDWNNEIGLITTSGDGAIMPGLNEAITSKLGIEVQVSEPFNDINISKQLSIDLEKKAPSYSIACGLAARGLL